MKRVNELRGCCRYLYVAASMLEASHGQHGRGYSNIPSKFLNTEHPSHSAGQTLNTQKNM